MEELPDLIYIGAGGFGVSDIESGNSGEYVSSTELTSVYAEFAEQDYVKSVQAFCGFYENTTGMTISYESAYSILEDFGFAMYMNHPWRRVTEEDQAAL